MWNCCSTNSSVQVKIFTNVEQVHQGGRRNTITTTTTTTMATMAAAWTQKFWIHQRMQQQQQQQLQQLQQQQQTSRCHKDAHFYDWRFAIFWKKQEWLQTKLFFKKCFWQIQAVFWHWIFFQPWKPPSIMLWRWYNGMKCNQRHSHTHKQTNKQIFVKSQDAFLKEW